MQNQPYSNLIEKINIAELDPTKVYFLQVYCGYIRAEQMQHIHRYLTDKFEEYGIRNIVLYSPSPEEMEVKFTEVKNGE